MPPRPAPARGGARRLGREPRGRPRRARRRGHRRLVLLRRPGGLAAEGYYAHEPAKLSAARSEAALRLPGTHLVFGLAKRWLLGTHHGAVSRKHLPAYLDEYVVRSNRRTARSIGHGFARLVEQAVCTRPTTYRAIVAATASA
jgi:hypothetical protein